MPSPSVNTTPGGGRRAKTLGERQYLPFNHDPKNLGTRTGRPMPSNVQRGSDGFEDIDAFFKSPPPEQILRAGANGGQLSTTKRTASASGSSQPLPRTPSRKGKGRMSDLGGDIEDDIGGGLVGDEEDSPGLEDFSTPHNQAYFSSLRDPPPSVTLPSRSRPNISSPNMDFNAIPSPRKSLSHKRLSKATSSRGMTPPDDDEEEEEEAFASGQVNGAAAESDEDDGDNEVEVARKRKQSIRPERALDPDADTDPEDNTRPPFEPGDAVDYDFVDDIAQGDAMDEGGLGETADHLDDGDYDDAREIGHEDEQSPAPSVHSSADEGEEEQVEEVPAVPVKRGRGRPRKSDTAPRKPVGRPAQSEKFEKRARSEAYSRSGMGMSVERHLDPDDLPTVSELHSGMPGDRRSSRRRIPPLAFWRNERVVYERGRKLKDIVLYDVEPVRPLGVAGKRGRGRSASSRPQPKAQRKPPASSEYDSEEDEVVDETVPMGIIKNQAGHEVYRRVACPFDKLEPREVRNSKFKYQKVFGDAQFLAGGVVFIPVGGEKPGKPSGDNSYVFYVISGVVRVLIHRTDIVLGRGASFFVPRGNHYSIHNLSKKNEAQLFFGQGRKLRASENSEDDEMFERVQAPVMRNGVPVNYEEEAAEQGYEAPNEDDEDGSVGAEEAARMAEDQSDEEEDVDDEEAELSPPPKKVKKPVKGRRL